MAMCVALHALVRILTAGGAPKSEPFASIREAAEEYTVS